MEHFTIAEKIDALISLAKQAAAEVLQYHKKNIEVSIKSDDSPVTQADIASHVILSNGLMQLTQQIPIVSEEESLPNADFAVNQHNNFASRFWLIDPLDGTRSFIKGGNDFSINIGLVEQNRAVFGLIAIPCNGDIYLGGQNIGAFVLRAGKRESIAARTIPESGVRVVKSASIPSNKMKEYIADLNPAEVSGISGAIKFCLIAEGKADIYPRFGRTMEWDTAAGQAILEAAGGSVLNVDGTEFLYGKQNFANTEFIARGKNKISL